MKELPIYNKAVDLASSDMKSTVKVPILMSSYTESKNRENRPITPFSSTPDKKQPVSKLDHQ